MQHVVQIVVLSKFYRLKRLEVYNGFHAFRGSVAAWLGAKSSGCKIIQHDLALDTARNMRLSAAHKYMRPS